MTYGHCIYGRYMINSGNAILVSLISWLRRSITWVNFCAGSERRPTWGVVEDGVGIPTKLEFRVKIRACLTSLSWIL